MDEYKPIRTLAYASVGIFALSGVLDIGSIGAGIAQIVSPGVVLDEEAGSVWMLLQALFALMQFPLYFAGVVVFLIWLHRAHKNLPALRAEFLEFTPGWAVGWWFIPFANLIKPFQVVREVWAESDPEVVEGPNFLSTSLHKAPTYMGFWWGFWIAMNISANITSGAMNANADVDGVGYLFIFGGLVSVIATLLVIWVVWDITRRQEERYARIGPVAPQEPPPPPTFVTEDISTSAV